MRVCAFYGVCVCVWMFVCIDGVCVRVLMYVCFMGCMCGLFMHGYECV